jgi:hypothetical protein
VVFGAEEYAEEKKGLVGELDELAIVSNGA